MDIINRNISRLSWLVLGFYFAATVMAFADDQKKNIVEVFNSLGGFISAGGAIAAILTVLAMVQSRREDKEQDIVKYSNYVLFILDRQIRYISMFGENNLKKHEHRSLNVKAYSVLATTFDPSLVNVIKIEESMFLLSLDRPELIAQLDETQRDYCSIASQIEQRNKIYLANYQAIIHENEIDIGSNVNVAEINELVGQPVVNELMLLTSQMYEMLPLIQQHLISVQHDLYSLLQVKYPRYKFLSPVSNVA
ncbi:hypothetical protein [Vibrio parahaemolyticus]|uniref:hypothetical protein n=1 Tax=Vibrio parahaemolyticus TaxID=670 RepID=UPI0023609C92|nr:hypothetical protein [Vibrio parahaemolyticus]